MNTTGELESYIFTKSINSDVVIACIDDFCERRTTRTIVVMDQASIHTSHRIENKRLEWEAKGVYIFWLPTYSQHLNLIEILWRFMKYEWIEFNAYESLETLAEYLEKVLKRFEDDYIINFA
jgi:transposase